MSDKPHPLVALAKRAIETYVRSGVRIPDPAPEELTDVMRERAGAFVSLHLKNGELRGCIGTFMPTRDNVAAEVIDNAIAACSRDPRFYPVTPEELDNLDVSVDVLDEPEPVSSIQELDPKVYGVIVTDLDGARRGLLLPMLDQVQTAEQQVAIARHKAFIGNDEPVKLYRFKVRRFQ